MTLYNAGTMKLSTMLVMLLMMISRRLSKVRTWGLGVYSKLRKSSAFEQSLSTPQKNNFCISASYFYFFAQGRAIHILKNLPFTNFKKCDKIYLKLIDTKINYNSSQLTASDVT